MFHWRLRRLIIVLLSSNFKGGLLLCCLRLELDRILRLISLNLGLGDIAFLCRDFIYGFGHSVIILLCGISSHYTCILLCRLISLHWFLMMFGWSCRDCVILGVIIILILLFLLFLTIFANSCILCRDTTLVLGIDTGGKFDLHLPLSVNDVTRDLCTRWENYRGWGTLLGHHILEWFIFRNGWFLFLLVNYLILHWRCYLRLLFHLSKIKLQISILIMIHYTLIFTP